MLRVVSSLLALTLLGIASAHPTYYPHRTLKATFPNASAPPPILSYHAHIVFNLVDIQGALRMRDQTIHRFKEWLDPECTGRFDNGRFCMIRDHEFDKLLVEGPFPSGEWSIFIPPPYLELVQTYLVQHYKDHGPFSLLIHPNTGFQIQDHSDWAMWAGASWPLNMETVNQTHTEDAYTRGDKSNPVCVASGNVCGELLQDFPTYLPCCGGASCGCGKGKTVCRCA